MSFLQRWGGLELKSLILFFRPAFPFSFARERKSYASLGSITGLIFR
jgi:hypothetical protein